MLNLLAPAVVLLALIASGTRQEAAITVSAAASLTDAMEAIAKAYAATGGGPVQFNFAGSNVLARQIANGAPVDVFVSADEAQMDVAQRAGGIDERTRVDLLGNRLAVVTRPGTHVAGPEALIGPNIQRIAIGDPAAVPAGVYARRYFEKSGVWDALRPKLIPVSNVRAALSAVEKGSADAAVVYVTDAALSRGVILAFVLDGPAAPRIVYPAAIVRATKSHAAAGRFLAFLRGPRASSIFQQLGFTPLGPAPR